MSEPLQDTSTREPPLAADARTFSSDEQGLREAAKWKCEQRGGESPIVDQHSTPIVERKLDDATNKDLEDFSATKALRAASKVISDQKKQESWQSFGINADLKTIEGVEDYAREHAEEGFQVHHPQKGNID